MREPVALAYLLARTSDTLADTESVEPSRRIDLLDGFTREIQGQSSEWRDDLRDFIQCQHHHGERVLIENIPYSFAALDSLPADHAQEVREVVATICRGQALDLDRFSHGPATLSTDSELHDYCHRVAGCVGIFWTKIGFLSLGTRFSAHDPAALETLGEQFGRGLQLVNILRDLPNDQAAGRGYLPSVPLDDCDRTLKESARWRRAARELLASGHHYAKAMRMRRLKLAVALPARLGGETLDLLDHADWQTMQRGVKVSRSCVWQNAFAAFCTR